MINSTNNPVWLIESAQIGFELKSACAFVFAAYRKYFVVGDDETIYYKINRISKTGNFDFTRWGVKRADALVCALLRGEDVSWDEIESTWVYPRVFNAAFVNFLRLVCLVLWARGVLLTPVSLPIPAKIDKVLDDLCELLNIKSLTLIRGLHVKSKFKGLEYKYKDNGRRASFWLRLLQNTTFYSGCHYSDEDMRTLCSNSYGSGVLPFRYYDTQGFLETVFQKNPVALECLEKIDAKGAMARLELSEAQKIRRRERERLRNVKRCRGSKTSSAFDALQLAISECVDYADGVELHDAKYLIENHFTPVRYRNIFKEGAPIYEQLPKVAVDFYNMFYDLFKSFMRFKAYEGKESAQYSVLNVIASYLLVYLPGFFMKRDGWLESYPRTLNDFSCVLFVTRDSIAVDNLFKFDKEPPLTLLSYLKMHADICPYKPSAHYAKVKFLHLFLSHVSSIRNELPSAENFNVYFGPGCFPRITKSYGTVKKALPRKYFGAFLSMLYSMEYLVQHLNYMAEGKLSGRIGEELVEVTPYSLKEYESWEGIWGRRNWRSRAVDLQALNYCPIFYSDGKIYKFEYIPRFYDVADYFVRPPEPEGGGDKQECVDKSFAESVVEERAIPNEVRITIFMCETGLRQNHTVWLDVDSYDKAVDRSCDSALTALQVATDKSHGAWTAIVSRNVVKVLDRQRKWYRSCACESYAHPIWYNEKSESKFGKIKPLFRRYNVSSSGWKTYSKFPVMLLALKYFIEHQVGDTEDYGLVYVSEADGLVRDFDDYTANPDVSFQWRDLVSEYTPHGLRAAFITDALNFLPPSIVGQYMTGQTEELVLYYQIVDGIYMPSHQHVLVDYLSRNLDKYSGGDAPEIAESIFRMSGELAKRIKHDIPGAIKNFGLISLQGTREGQNGMDILLAEKFTQLAYNPTHICPFGNKCPVEVMKDFGSGRPCGVCPYAIRGVMHLPAISAEKDKYKELMLGIVGELREITSRKSAAQREQEIENLNAEHDYYAREAYALEATEQQLYKMYQNGDYQSFLAKGKSELMLHFEKIKVAGSERLMKRLVDTLAWPSVSTPRLDLDFAYLRARLLMHDGNLEELLSVQGGTPASQLSSVVKSMVDSGALDVMDLVRFANEPVRPEAISKSQLLLADLN
ncbi:hypothetical protein H0H12_19565 [Pseudomonas putida]|uniref:Integrase n=1 Tax=Pseudomonas putida TaxID=303 RepID=A0A7D5ZVU5_PSEPU|nr:hypothetical protein [Pseudomonas putida]QLJ12636.1 hypothetical protein H0H12_19565 [Pseudomonas putida]